MLSPKDQSYSDELIELVQFKKVTLKKRCTGRIKADNGTVLRLNNGKLSISLKNFVASLTLEHKVAIYDQPGRVLKESDYYRLTALDNLGRTWTAAKVLVNEEFINFPGGINSKLKGTFLVCSDLVCKGKTARSKSNNLTDELCNIRFLISEDIVKNNISFQSPLKRLLESGSKAEYTFSDDNGGNSISLRTVSFSEKQTRIEVCYKSTNLAKPIATATSLCEALQFVLGQYVSWFYLERHLENQVDIWIRPSSRQLNHNKINPPIRLNRILWNIDKPHDSQDTNVVICHESHFWFLYEQYFAYVFNSSTSDAVHEFSGWMIRLIEVGPHSLEAQILTAVVAVESITKKLFKQKEASSADNLKKQTDIVEAYHEEEETSFSNLLKSIRTIVTSLFKHKEASSADELRIQADTVESWLKEKENDFSDSFMKRCKGFLGSIRKNETRAIDNLYKLRDENLLDEELVKSWKKLRNSAAHGSFIKSNKRSDYIQHYENVHVLFFQLIFLAIGYEGPFSNYSKDNWPTENFDKRLT